MKKEYIFLAIVIVVLSLYLIFRSQDKTHYSLPRLATIEESEVSRLVVKLPDSSITLKHHDREWKIMPYGYPAGGTRLSDMMESMENMEITDMVSQSRNYQRYDLSPEKRIEVKVYSDDQMIRSLVIGKAAPTRHHTYVMLNEDPNVYQCRNNIRRKFEVEAKDLRDRQVMAFTRTAIRGLDIACPDDSLSIREAAEQPSGEEGAVPPDVQWETGAGEQLDERALDKLITALNNLKCTEYINDRSKDDFKDPIYTITLDTPEEASLSIFEMNQSNKYPAISSQNDYPFLISKYKGEQIMKKREDLLEEKDTEE